MTDSVETIRCSNCKRDILSSNFVIHDIHCQRNIYLCSKCNEPVSHSQKAEHDEANHVLIYCSSCHTQIEKFMLNDHMSNDCSRRKVKCQICDIEVVACDITEHENYCGARTEKCPECGEFVMLKYKQLHIDSNHTFIKLSDEPGPSPSWQNGRRTLGNFFPDLDLTNYTPQQHHKKKWGRNESGRRHAKASPELTDSCNKSFRDSCSPNEKQRLPSLQKNFENHSASCFKDERGKLPRGATESRGKFRSRKDSDEVRTYSVSNDVNYDKEVEKDPRELLKTGKQTQEIDASSSEHKDENLDSKCKQTKKKSDILNEIEFVDDDSSLALALQLSNELNGGFQLDYDNVIAQAIEENTAVLSEFNLFDNIEKSKATSGKNLSKNFYRDKKLNKSVPNSQLSYNADDSSDDEFLLYSKKPSNDVDEASLPCQFCGSMFPSHDLMSHQKSCNSYEDFSLLDKYREKGSGRGEKEGLVPCDICYRLIPFSRYNSHQAITHSVASKK